MIMQTQIIYTAPQWIAEVSDGFSWTEVARGEAASEEMARIAAQAALNSHLGVIDGTDELVSAQSWGSAVVRAFEAEAMNSGINSVPVAALALDRYLREVSGALSAGRLHVAYAAMQELLSQPEVSRPMGASNAQMMPIFMAIAQRLQLPAEIVEQSLLDIQSAAEGSGAQL